MDTHVMHTCSNYCAKCRHFICYRYIIAFQSTTHLVTACYYIMSLLVSRHCRSVGRFSPFSFLFFRSLCSRACITSVLLNWVLPLWFQTHPVPVPFRPVHSRPVHSRPLVSCHVVSSLFFASLFRRQEYISCLWTTHLFPPWAPYIDILEIHPPFFRLTCYSFLFL